MLQQQTFSFVGKIKKANSRGTGFIYLPRAVSPYFVVGDFVSAQFLQCHFFAKIVEIDKNIGLYIPQSFTLHGQLIGISSKIIIQKINGFYAPIAKDGTVYLSGQVAIKHNLQKNNIIAITVFQREKIPVIFYRKICVLTREDRKRKEYIIRLPKLFSGQDITFQIRKLPLHAHANMPSLVSHLVRGMNYASTGSSSLVVFHGNKMPSLLNPDIQWVDIARYLGAYFSDGTKMGNSWAITASTFFQGRWYLQMHKKIISDANPKFDLVYTIYDSLLRRQSIEKKLRTQWGQELNVCINNVRFIPARGRKNNKWHENGTLVIREHRQILLSVYRNLLAGFMQELERSKDTDLAWEFLFGILEGDGCAPATKRGHLLIATNRNQYQTIEKILNILQLEFKTIKEEWNQYRKYYIRIGALELLRNFSIVEPQVFSYYPSRKNLFLRRFHTTGAVRFFTEDHTPASWIKTWLKNHGFVGINRELTPKGSELRDSLLRTTDLISERT